MPDLLTFSNISKESVGESYWTILSFPKCKYCVYFRRVCEIVQVLSLYACANGAPLTNRQSKAADSDTIVISDSDDESDVFQSPTAHLNGLVDHKPLWNTIP